MIKELLSLFQIGSLWGLGLLICRWFDGYKYHKLSSKIRQVKSSKGHSRDFANIAIGVDIFTVLYLIFHKLLLSLRLF